MFIESHMHITLDGIDFKTFRKKLKQEGNKEILRSIFKIYKKNNIYAIRDGGDNLGVGEVARKLAKEEGVIYKTPICAIYKKGCYGSFLGQGIRDIYDFKSTFNKLKEKEPDHLKIILTGMISFTNYGDVGEVGFTLDELKYMVDAAKDRDMTVMVHVNSSEAINLAIDSGVDTIEHGYFITERELYKMGEKDIVWVPTLTPLGNILNAKESRYEKEIPVIQKSFNQHLKSIYKAYDMKVKLAIGSDAGSYGVYHGKGFFDEIDYLETAGIPRTEIIKMSFDNGCRALGLNKEEIAFLQKI